MFSLVKYSKPYKMTACVRNNNSIWISLLFLISLSKFCDGFNLDITSPIVHNGVPDTLFGYSVSLHTDGNVDWLLVGAPKAETAQPGVEEGGAVYKCPTAPLDNLAMCEQIPLDTTGNGDITQKSYQWLGSTISSSGVNGSVIVCAPRFVFYGSVLKKDEWREPVGNCFITSSNFQQLVEYSPCKSSNEADWGFAEITHCQAGFSAELFQLAGNRGLGVFVGAPGSYYMQGQVYVGTQAPGVMPITNEIKTGEGESSEDDSYRGFAVSVGVSDPDGLKYYAGAPRGASLRGYVSVFSSSLKSLHNFTGEQLGSYFGHAVQAVDVNNDGYDDVIIGAPMYSDQRPGFSNNWEAGKIYIYYQETNQNKRDNMEFFRETPDHIIGEKTQARFGYSITSLGDVDYDGFNDIAVGAPYGGSDGKGLVYVYYGSPAGLILEPSQILSPSVLNITSDVSTFGFSLDGGMDMDKNNYPDLAIGAQKSSTVAVVRSRPVVQLVAELNLIPEGINLDNQNLELADGTMVSSFEVQICFTYKGKYIPNEIDIYYTVDLDSLHVVGQRVLFYPDGTTSLQMQAETLSKGDPLCHKKTAYFKSTIQDKLSPIQVEVNYNLVEDRSSLAPHEILPVLSAKTRTSVPKQVYILNNCNDNICVPDLVLGATLSSNKIVVGSSDVTILNLDIRNDGDDSYQSILRAHIPEGLQFVRVERPEKLDISITCEDDKETNIITCDVGNPLQANYKLQFGLALSSDQISGNEDQLEFFLQLSSENAEPASTLHNNQQNMTVYVTVEAELIILSASNPEQVQFLSEMDKSANRKFEKEQDIGPQVEHLYEIRNQGPSTVSSTDINISWPVQNSDGKYVLYLISIEPRDKCSLIESELNPENLRLISNLSYDDAGQNSRSLRQAADAQTSTVSCSTAKCVRISCRIGRLVQNQGEVIRITSRFWNETFRYSTLASVEIISKVRAEVKSTPYGIKMTNLPSATAEAKTIASPEVPPAPSLAWWIILIAILCGLLLLALIVYALWRAGFFKRKRPYEIVHQNEPNNGTKPADL